MQALAVALTAQRRRGPAAVLLDFTAGALPPGLSVARSGAAMHVGPDGLLTDAPANTARRDHVFGTGAPLGLLVEGAGTNELHRSSTFEDAVWFKRNFGTSGAVPAVSDASATAPDGSMSAAVVSLDAVDAAGQSSLEQNLALGAGDYTLSVWLRTPDGAGSAVVRLRVDTTGGANATNVTVTEAWQRFSMTVTGAPDVIVAVIAKLRPSTGTATTATVHAWGAQIELGTQPTSPIATAASPASRSADAPALDGISGTYDVTALYPGGGSDSFPAVSVAPGYWPALSEPRLAALHFTPA